MKEQEIATNIGKSGCLALCYIRLAQIKLNSEYRSPLAILADNYNSLLNKGIIDEDCYINNAENFIRHIFNIDTRISKETENPKNGSVIAYNGKHFVIVDENDEIVWNSLDNDRAWYNLPIKSYRTMRII